MHGTTVLAVRRGDKTAVGGDGQVTHDNIILKSGARKVRKIFDGKIIVGFAGAVADALTLFARFEDKLQAYGGNLERAAVELARDWRTDKILRQLQALMVACSKDKMLLISGTGDVIEPDEGIVGIGSGGAYAAAAAQALFKHTDMSAEEIVHEALLIASRICVYTNDNITIETL